MTAAAAAGFDLRGAILDALFEAADTRKDKYAFCADCRDQACPDHEDDDRVAWKYELAAALISPAGSGGDVAAILAATSTTNRGTQ